MGLAHTNVSQSFAAKAVKDEENPHKKRIVFHSARFLQHWLNVKCKDGDLLTVTVTNKKPKRTTAQNNYYWLYVHMISDETGNDPEDLHNLFKGKFLGGEIVNVMGHKVRRSKSTTSLTVPEFGEYIDNIAAFTGIEPPPTENFHLRK